MSQTKKSYRASELADLLAGELIGADLQVNRLCDLKEAQADCVVVLADTKTVAALKEIEAVLVLNQRLELPLSQVIVKDTRLAFAQLSQLFAEPIVLAEGIHPSAVIHETVKLAENVHIGPHVVIAEGVEIGAGTQIAANSFIGKKVKIGKDCTLFPNVSLYPEVELGDRVRLHAGVVVGSDGFGYARSPRGALKIQHMGRVIIEDDVELGTNTCVDRATLGATVIGARTKIDNLCQIGHNVKIGSDCLIAGTVAVAGSTTLGRGVILGGGAGVVDHVHIGDGAQVGARSLVTKSIPAGETWNGYPAEPYKKYVRKHYLLGKLEQIWQTIKEN